MSKPPYEVVLDLDAFHRLSDWITDNNAKQHIAEVALRYPRQRGETFCVSVFLTDRSTALMLKLALG